MYQVLLFLDCRLDAGSNGALQNEPQRWREGNKSNHGHKHSGGAGHSKHSGRFGKKREDPYDDGPDSSTRFEWTTRTIVVAVAVTMCALLANAAGIGASYTEVVLSFLQVPFGI